ncbi:MAG TPA: N-acetylmuramoyl-L-alanine amidase [Candidatus Baltobacteraceae bacterium]|jgi:N-acetylmuramoyl-L-alanine amidase|nr:N-acetylmuramoyl-L-alanine amidase [Candidatus Baltobacteraceae bacterium]
MKNQMRTAVLLLFILASRHSVRREGGMRIAVLLLFFLTARAQAGVKNLERVTVSGSEYVRVAEWADNAGLTMKWNRKDQDIALSGPVEPLEFTVDSRKIQIGGVTVWLSLPIVNRSGVALVSLADLRTTLEPVLFPRKSDARVQTICLDPGHGGKDSGKTDHHNYEKQYTLLLGRQVESLLKDDGFKVVLTRTTDETVELPDRALIASRRGADLFVSMHYNAADTDVRGVEVYCLTPAGMNSSDVGGGRSPQLPDTGNAQDERNVLLAYEVQRSITRSLPLEDRGMKRSRFEVLREARMPAILIEGGFMSQPEDARNIYDAAFRKRMARAIADGILAYKHAVERQGYDKSF